MERALPPGAHGVEMWGCGGGRQHARRQRLGSVRFFGYNIMAFPSAEVKGFLLGADRPTAPGMLVQLVILLSKKSPFSQSRLFCSELEPFKNKHLILFH